MIARALRFRSQVRSLVQLSVELDGLLGRMAHVPEGSLTMVDVIALGVTLDLLRDFAGRLDAIEKGGTK